VKRKQAAGPDLVFSQNRSQNALYAMSVAVHLYTMMHGWGLVRKLSSALTGRSNRLLDLAAVRRACDVGSRRFGGIRAVPLDGTDETFDRGILVTEAVIFTQILPDTLGRQPLG